MKLVNSKIEALLKEYGYTYRLEINIEENFVLNEIVFHFKDFFTDRKYSRGLYACDLTNDADRYIREVIDNSLLPVIKEDRHQWLLDNSDKLKSRNHTVYHDEYDIFSWQLKKPIKQKKDYSKLDNFGVF